MALESTSAPGTAKNRRSALSNRRLPLIGSFLLLAIATNSWAEPTRSSAPKIDLQPCAAVGQAEGAARCGTLEVFEDRNRGAGRTISLNVVVLPALGEPKAPDPLFILAGGPGQAATRLHWIPFVFFELRQNRDIVLVDQRGTGDSHPLACDPPSTTDPLQAALDPLLDPEWVRACRRKLEQVADLRFYSTVHAVDDLDDVRAALGYEEINLYGGSYGTRPALVYLRRYPKRARSAVVMGVAHTSFKYPLLHAPAGQRALDLLFEACRQSPECLERYGDPQKNLEKVLRLFDDGPVPVRLSSFDNDRASLRFERDVMTERLRTLMYHMASGVRIPGLLQRAAKTGDLAELAQEVIGYDGAFREGVDWYSGMWLSVSCTEDAPFVEPDEVSRLTSSTIFRDYRIRGQLEACAEWPRGDLPRGFEEHVRSSVPVLILSGELDPATPPSSGAAAAASLTNSLHVVARQGHSPTNVPCFFSVVSRFIDQPKPRDLDFSCLEEVDLPAWK